MSETCPKCGQAAHDGDLVRGITTIGGIWRDEEYVAAECAKLAASIAEYSTADPAGK